MFAQKTFSWFLAFSLATLLAACAQVQDEGPGLAPQATRPALVRMHLASGTGNSYLATDAGQKEIVNRSCSLQFRADASAGGLLKVSVNGPSGSVPCHKSTNQLLGVFSPGEGIDKKLAVNPGESLSLALGDDTNLVGLKATFASLSVQPTTVSTLFDVQFYDGAKLLGKKQVSPTGAGTAPKVFTLSYSGKPFTRIQLVPVKGAFSLKGTRDVVRFKLVEAVSEYRYKYEYEYAWNRSYSVAASGYACGGLYVTGTNSENSTSRDYWWITHVYRGEVIGGNLLRLSYLYTEAGDAVYTFNSSYNSLVQSTTTTIRGNGNSIDPETHFIVTTWTQTGTNYYCGQNQSPEPTSGEDRKGFWVHQSLDLPLNQLSDSWKNEQDCRGDIYTVCSTTETRKWAVTPK